MVIKPEVRNVTAVPSPISDSTLKSTLSLVHYSQNNPKAESTLSPVVPTVVYDGSYDGKSSGPKDSSTSSTHTMGTPPTASLSSPSPSSSLVTTSAEVVGPEESYVEVSDGDYRWVVPLASCKYDVLPDDVALEVLASCDYNVSREREGMWICTYGIYIVQSV